MKKRTFEKWFDNGNKVIIISNWKQIRKQHRIDYPNDIEINSKRIWGIRTNGAKRGNPKDWCLDLTINLGHISINYTNFSFNKRFR